MFSANFALPFSDQPPIARVRATARAGFDEVEPHVPRDTPANVLPETVLGLSGFAPAPGDVATGEFGPSAVPDRGEVRDLHPIHTISETGFTGPIDAKYKPRETTTEAGLGWLDIFRKELQ